MKKGIILLFAFVLACQSLMGQSGGGYWEEIAGPPGGRPDYVTQTANGWMYAHVKRPKAKDGSERHWWYVSKDSAKTWTEFQFPEYKFSKNRIGRSGKLYATLYENTDLPSDSVLVSIDGGFTWKHEFIGLTVFDALDNSKGDIFLILKGQLPPPRDRVLWRKMHGSVIWDSLGVFTEIDINRLDQLFSITPGLFVRLVSTDDGLNWRYTPSWITQFVTDFVLADSIYFSNNSLSSLTKNFGQLGAVMEPIYLEPSIQANSLCHIKDSLLLATSNRGLFKSTNFGQTWTLIKRDNFYSPLLSPVLDDSNLIPANFGSNHAFIDLTGELVQGSFGPIPNQQYCRQIFKASSKLIFQGQILYARGINDHIWIDTVPRSDSPIPISDVKQIGSQNFVFCTRDSMYEWNTESGLLRNITPLDSMSLYSVAGCDSILICNYQNINSQTPLQITHKSRISFDFGNNWQIFKDTLVVYDLVQHPSGRVFLRLGDSNFSRWIMTSDWLSFENLPNYITTWISVLSDGTLRSGYYRSNDNGITWIPTSTYWLGTAYMNSFNHAYANLSSGMKYSIDNQQTWITLPSNDPDSTMNGDQLLIGLDDQGFIYSVNRFDYSTARYFRSRQSTLYGAYLTGSTFKDSDSDCSTLDPEAPLPNWIVSATKGQDTWSTNTDSLGQYSMFIDTGTYQVTTSVPADIFWVECADSVEVNLPVYLDTVVQELPAIGTVDCPYISVDLGIPFLNPCFDGTAALAVHNYGTVSADTVWVDVQFPPEVYVIDTSAQYDSIGVGLYRFWFGALEIGIGAQINFDIQTVCDTALTGQTLCVSAQAYPDSLCAIPVGWSGAQVNVSAFCQGDSTVRFDLSNPTSISTQNLDFIIIEDDVVLRQGNHQYSPGQTLTETVPMTQGNHLYRLQTEQEPGHPFAQLAFAWVEGCGPGQSNAGNFIQQYMMDNGIPAEDVECIQVTGSYDPNDKQGQPLGFGVEHLIEPNTEIEYTVRFQNTGTAAARFVNIRDTLSPHLDATSIRMGAASHPYTWSLNGQSNLLFRFDPINLPDSTTDFAGSQGFISFKVKQKANLPLGTQIHNKASIYFDYNGSVVTNTTLHTLGRDFITLVAEPPATVGNMTLNPNPVQTQKRCTITGLAENQLFIFTASNAHGQTKLTQNITGPQAEIDCSSLAAGMYFFTLTNAAGTRVGQGKLIVGE